MKRWANGSVQRRQFLALAGATGVASLAGCPNGATVTDDDRDLEVNRSVWEGPNRWLDTVNVQEVGADATGETLVDDVLEEQARSHRRLYFPEGTYRLGEFSGTYNYLVLRGDGATIVPEDRSSLWRLLDVRGSNNAIQGFVFDYRDVEMPPMVAMSGPRGWSIRDCLFRGIQQTGIPEDGGFAILPATTDEDGVGRIENVYLHNGSAPQGGGDSRGGIWFGSSNTGTIHIDNVWMEYWADNGIYGHNSPGSVIIENSFFRNTNVAATRIGGHSRLRNNTYIKTGRPPKLAAEPDGSGRLMRGIWITGGQREHGSAGSVLIEDCDFIFTDGESTSSAILHSSEIDGQLRIKDCRIRQDVGYAIHIADQADVCLENVHITGSTEEPAIFVRDGIPVDPVSGAVETRGPISNRTSVKETFIEESAKGPDPAPPDGLTEPSPNSALGHGSHDD